MVSVLTLDERLALIPVDPPNSSDQPSLDTLLDGLELEAGRSPIHRQRQQGRRAPEPSPRPIPWAPHPEHAHELDKPASSRESPWYVTVLLRPLPDKLLHSKEKSIDLELARQLRSLDVGDLGLFRVFSGLLTGSLETTCVGAVVSFSNIETVAEVLSALQRSGFHARPLSDMEVWKVGIRMNPGDFDAGGHAMSEQNHCPWNQSFAT